MNLIARTAALGLYRLEAGSAVRRELEAYEAAMEPLRERIQALEVSADPAGMGREALEAACARCGLAAPPGLEEAALRRAVGALLRGAECTPAGVRDYLAALGVDAALDEDPAAGRVTLDVKEPAGLCPDVETLRRTVERVLPAGVRAALDVGRLTWEMLDEGGLTAAQLDEKEFTWAWFDLHGHQLVEGA